ncbi:glutathione S-transferase [Proteobacteria bacterium 005FR1]|nr:glutathione S-transferase [Proteobacteria bacterium 005FR1]
MATHQLIGSPISYYTGKARAYLRFKKIPFEEVLSSREVYEQLIVPRVGYPIIPVMVTEDDKTLQDTTDIIDYLEARYPEPSIYPATPRQKLVSLLMEIYGDEWLVIPAMHYRWNLPENREYAYRQFGATSAPEKSPEEQRQIGFDRAQHFAGMVPRLGATEHNRDAIEKSYLQLLSDFDAHLAEYPFLLGTRPSIGDYGLIGPLYAHLWLDPASGKIMEAHAPRVVQWVKRVHEPQEHGGEFLPNDEVPKTLFPMLARMFNEHLPVLMSTMDHVEQWAEANPGERKLPRAIGMHEFTVEGVRGERAIFPANQWMWQRAADFYQSLDDDGKAQVRDVFADFPNAIAALERPIRRRVVRENFRFTLEG